MNQIDLSDVVKAIRDNGLPQIKFSFFKSKAGQATTALSDDIIGACAIGQAAINLGKNPVQLMRELNGNDYINEKDCTLCDGVGYLLGNMITHLNDVHELTFAEIADYLEREYIN